MTMRRYESLIGDFIDTGIDILNPVQCSAAGMEPKHLNETYGDKIVFWGGGVDTQKTLPAGSAEEVRKQVMERLSIFSPYCRNFRTKNTAIMYRDKLC